jgi:Holliday junction resolvase RusA-like endonuclease
MTALQTPALVAVEVGEATSAGPNPRAAVPDLMIIAYGRPAPQGSKMARPIYRGRGADRVFTGKVAQVESSKNGVNDWRADVKDAAEKVTAGIPGWAPLDGPLVARIVFTVAKPLSAPKRRRTWPDRMPDLSKLLRSTEDALTGAGAWRDDARVVEYLRLAKVYPGEDRDALVSPGALIQIWRATS